MSVSELVDSMNAVDIEALEAVTNCKDQISAFVEELVPRMMKGGRLLCWRWNKRKIRRG